jgi:hypothetical protein
MATILQPELSLPAARLRKPVVKRDGALNVLELEDWQLEAVIDRMDGVLNVASPRTTRRELRFVVVCLEECKRSLRTAYTPPARTDEQLTVMIFGQPQPLIRAQRIKSRLMIHATHFYDLARERVIRLAKGSEQRSGPGGSAVVEWSALVEFIKKRRIA